MTDKHLFNTKYQRYIVATQTNQKQNTTKNQILTKMCEKNTANDFKLCIKVIYNQLKLQILSTWYTIRFPFQNVHMYIHILIIQSFHLARLFSL